jgi:Na+/H+-translocating membrane pyrophosphatase
MKELPPQIEKEEPKKGLSSKETYNAVSDTVVGVNVRKKDNIIQGLIILVTVIIGLVIGQMYGGFLMLGGLIIGFLVSGIFLMIYRAVKHASGDHG